MTVPRGLRVEEQDPGAGRIAGYRDHAREEKRLVITRDWIDPAAGLSGLVAVVVDGAAAATLVFAHGHPLGVLLGAVLAGPGGFATYGALAKILNATRIVVDRGSLTVEHAPIWWPGRVRIETSQITRVFGEMVSGKHCVVAMVDGKGVRLASDLDVGQAEYIAARLRRELGLVA